MRNLKSFTDCYTLNNGVNIPCMAFGTYNPHKEDMQEIVKNAIRAGIRYFDTASLYGTEREVGNAIKESGIPRKEFFITSKAWIDERGYDEVKEAFGKSLERLGTDYLDMYMIHWPRRAEGDTDWKTKNADTWKAMEELYDAGKIRALGLSNFLPHHAMALLSGCRVKPAVDQFECHPGYTQEIVTSWCFANGIRPQAWGAVGRGKSRLEELKAVSDMAEKYGRSTQQIALRFLVQKGIIPVFKAASPEHIREDLEAMNFDMEEEDISLLSCMPQTEWLGEHPDYAIPKAVSRKQ